MAEQPVYQERVVQTKQVEDTVSETKNQVTAVNVVWFIFAVIAIFLAFRFVFLLAGANPQSGFVSFVYSVSSVLAAPFDTIFGTATSRAGEVTSVFQPSVLVAIAVYALIAWGVSKLIRINKKSV